MRFLSLFSGIEAASVAWRPLGWECVAVAEIEKFPCALLRHHYPNTPNLGDVTKITREQIESLGQIDVVIFGFPCQDLSVAGKRKGLENADGTLTRSGLFFHAEQISRWSKARWTVAENVPGLFSSNEGRDFATVVGELAGSEFDVPGEGWRSAGVALGPRGLVEWCVLDAQYFGLAQRRKRVFLVRDSGTQWQYRPPLFLKPPSMWRDSAPRRQTRERTPADAQGGLGSGGLHELETCPTLQSRNTAGGGLGGDFEGSGGLVSTHEVAHPLLAKGNSSHRTDAESYVAHTLKAEGHDASEDGTGRGVPLVAATLDANFGKLQGCSGQDLNHGHSHLVAETAWALQERDSKGSDSSTKDGHLIPVEHCVAFHENQRGEVTENNTAGTLKNGGGKPGQGYPAAFTGTAVRRLTPEECEALQGFPRGYTKIDDKTADGPRYKSLGNSFAVPVISWIGRQIEFCS